MLAQIMFILQHLGASFTSGFKRSQRAAILATSSSTTALCTASAASFPQVKGP